MPLDKDSKEAIDMCYYAPGHHPRSFYARWVWLGLRNRASALSVALGKKVEGEHYAAFPHPLMRIYRIGDVWRYYEELPIGSLYIRMHCGYKIPVLTGNDRAPVVSIGFSLRRQ